MANALSSKIHFLIVIGYDPLFPTCVTSLPVLIPLSRMTFLPAFLYLLNSCSFFKVLALGSPLHQTEVLCCPRLYQHPPALWLSLGHKGVSVPCFVSSLDWELPRGQESPACGGHRGGDIGGFDDLGSV